MILMNDLSKQTLNLALTAVVVVAYAVVRQKGKGK
jgi:hypothetical protein